MENTTVTFSTWPKLLSIPDPEVWGTLERALRDRIGLAYHSACLAHTYGSNYTLRDVAALDAEYELAVTTYRVIVGIDPIATN
jgi:hypothetical protein